MDPERRATYDALAGFSADSINPFTDASLPADQVFVDEFTCIGCRNLHQRRLMVVVVVAVVSGSGAGAVVGGPTGGSVGLKTYRHASASAPYLSCSWNSLRFCLPPGRSLQLLPSMLLQYVLQVCPSSFAIEED